MKSTTLTEPIGPASVGHRGANNAWFNRDAASIFIGQLLSMVGDQFTLIALPWLAYATAQNPADLGLILGLLGFPRAVMVSGKLVDRWSAKTVSLVSRAASAVLLMALAVTVSQWPTNTAAIYTITVLIGAASAFTIVSSASILPAVFQREHLAAVNAVGQSIRVGAGIVGPLAAAWLMHAGGDAAARPFEHSASLAFGIDALTFIASFVLLLGVRTLPAAPSTGESGNAAPASTSPLPGPELKALFVYFLAISVVAAGSMQIIVPTLVSQRLGGDASLFSIVVAIYGAGSMAGMGIAARLNAMVRHHCGRLMLGMDFLTGFGYLLLMNVGTRPAAIAVALLLGAAAGVVQVSTFTWIQHHVDRRSIGKTMAMFLFVFVGIVPVTAPLFGFIKTLLSLDAFLLAVGTSVILISFAACFNRHLRGLKY